MQERAGEAEKRLCDADFAPIERRRRDESDREFAAKQAVKRRQFEERHAEEQAQAQRRANERVVRWAVYAAVVLGVFWWARSQGESGATSLAITGAVAGIARPYARDKHYDEHDRFWAAVWGAAILAGLGYLSGLVLY